MATTLSDCPQSTTNINPTSISKLDRLWEHAKIKQLPLYEGFLRNEVRQDILLDFLNRCAAVIDGVIEKAVIQCSDVSFTILPRYII